ncbi:MAG: SRPBCC domain-containing protein, partial [bacterium]
VAEPVVGSIAEFKFGDRYHNKMRIDTLETGRRVEWECLEGDPEWIGTRLVFDLEKQGDQTLLRFAHTRWREITDFFASCNYNWGFYMRSLKLYCEQGEGEPFEYRA